MLSKDDSKIPLWLSVKHSALRSYCETRPPTRDRLHQNSDCVILLLQPTFTNNQNMTLDDAEHTGELAFHASLCFFLGCDQLLFWGLSLRPFEALMSQRYGQSLFMELYWEHSPRTSLEPSHTVWHALNLQDCCCGTVSRRLYFDMKSFLCVSSVVWFASVQ